MEIEPGGVVQKVHVEQAAGSRYFTKARIAEPCGLHEVKGAGNGTFLGEKRDDSGRCE